MHAPTMTTNKRLPSLDGLRAVAVSLVLLSHIPYSGAPNAVSEWTGLLFDGNLGVRIFFTLSGFIITLLLLKEHDKQGRISLVDFWKRRALRILPVVFGYLALLAVLQLMGRVEIATSSWIGNLTFSRNMVGRGDDPSIHLWSLSVEEQFYLAWPIMLVILGPRSERLWKLGVAIIVATLVLRASVPDSVQNNSAIWARVLAGRSALRYCDTLVIGGLTAIWMRGQNRILPIYLPALSAAMLVLPLLTRFSSIELPAPISSAFITIQAMGTAGLIVWTISTPSWVASILNSKPMVILGLLSYSLYIWHFIFLSSFAPNGVPSPLNAWWFWPIVSFAAATLSYAVLEWPARAHRRARAGQPNSLP